MAGDMGLNCNDEKCYPECYPETKKATFQWPLDFTTH